MAVGDELLAAGQPEAVARALGLHRDRVAMLGALVDRQRGDGLAGEDAGKPALGVRACPSAPRPRRPRWRGRARARGCARSPPARRPPRHGRGRARRASSPIRMPVKPISANCFHRSREKPVASLRVAQLAQVRDRGVFGDEIARGVAQHRLFVVEVEGHLLFLRHPRRRAGERSCCDPPSSRLREIDPALAGDDG